MLILALAPFFYYALAIYCSWAYFRVRENGLSDRRDFTPAASILKPVRGVDREAYLNFSSFCRLNYPDYEILFAVEEPTDPVVAVIQRLQGEFPNIPIRLITDVPQPGANRKLNSLCVLAREAANELLVISDSDVRVHPDYLLELAAPFKNDKVGAVTTFFRAATGGNLITDLLSLVGATETVPNALVAGKLEGKLKFLFGWTMATMKCHLAGIGGFEGMRDHHSDDFEMGNRMAAHGLDIQIVNRPIEMFFSESTPLNYWLHEMRWAIGLRNVRPAGYLGQVLTFGLPWALLAVWAAPSLRIALFYPACYLLLRLGLVWLVGVRGLDDSVVRKRLWLVPLRDALGFIVWIVAFCTSRIHWRGCDYVVKDKLLQPVGSSKAFYEPRALETTTVYKP